MALVCNANTNAAATRVWQTGTETATQGLSAATFLWRFKVTGQSGTTSVHVGVKGGDQFGLRRKSGSATVYQFAATTSTAAAPTIDFTPSAGAWHTVVVTWDSALGSARQKLYLDGTLGNTANAAGNTNSPAGNDRIQIGVDAAGIDCRYDEFCVWNRVLTGTEIANLQTQRAADAAASGRVVNYDFHGSPGSGNVTNGQSYLNDVSGNSQPALVVQSGTPTWVSDDPLHVAAPALSVSVRGKTLAAGSTTDLGTWPVGTDVALRLRLDNNGDASLTVTGATLTGDGTLVSTGLAATYAAGAGADIVLNLSNAAAGAGKSLTLTLASNDGASPSYAVTLSYGVRQDADRTLAPHASWSGTAGGGFSDNGGGGSAIPTASATPHGSGFDSYAPAVAADIDGFDWVDGSSLYLCVATDTSDLGDIDYVDFYHEGATKRVYTKALSPRTGVEGFLVQLTAPFAGAADVYWKVVPVNGLEVVNGCRVWFNTDGSLYGTTTNITTATNPAAAIASASAGDRIRLAAGTYSWTDSGSNFYPAKPVFVELAAGLSAGDVVVARSGGRGLINVRPSKVVWRDIQFDTATVSKYVGLGNNAGNDARAGTKFERCRFTDSNGVTGPARGYATTDGSLAQVFFVHDRNQPYYLAGCTATTYNGLCGATCVVGCDITMSFDALYVGSTAATGHLFANLDVTEGGRFKQRCHTEQTLTASADSGTGPTTVTFSGSPTLQTLTSSDAATLEVLTGALAGQTFAVTSSDNAAKTVTVSGNASALSAGDTCWVYLYAHPDVLQLADSSNPNGVIAQRVRATIDHTEPFRIDLLDNTKQVKGVWFQTCAIVLADGAGVGNVAAWESDQVNCGIRQCTIERGFVPETGSDFDVTACAVYDNALVSAQGSPSALSTDATKIRLDNNHYTSSILGTNATGPASANVDATGKPQAGSPLLSRLYGARLRYDAYGNAFAVDGSGPVGGVSDATAAASATRRRRMLVLSRAAARRIFRRRR